MVKKHLGGAMVALALGSVVGCGPTSFQGDARFPDGALGCFNQCQKINMEMATFVYVGEYSTACACKPKVAAPVAPAPAAAPTSDSGGDSEAAVVAAAAGVELQRRRMEQQQQQQMGPAPAPIIVR